MIILTIAYFYKRLFLDHRPNKSGSVIKMPHFLMRLQPVVSKEKPFSNILLPGKSSEKIL